MAVKNLVSRVPDWLFAALKLQEPNLPNQLEVDRILSVLDTYQGGWAVASWRLVENTQGASVTGSMQVITNTREQCALVSALEVEGIAFAAAKDLVVLVRDDVLVKDVRIHTSVLGAAGAALADRVATSQDIFGGALPYFLPPGCSLIVGPITTGVGESVTLRALVSWFPVGFKVV